MKKTLVLCSLLGILFASSAQVTLDKVVKKTKKKIEQRTEKKIDKAIDKGLDKVEEGVDNTAKGETTSKKSNSKTTMNSKEKEATPVAITPDDKPTLNWAQYDFIPGKEIIFEDDFLGEKNGEFPSKWDLVSGMMENANFGGDNVVMFRKCNINGIDGIVPLLKNSTIDYLPEEFTIEFDAYFEKYNYAYRIYLFDSKNQKNLTKENSMSNRNPISFEQNSVRVKDLSKSYYPGFGNANTKSTPNWRHFAISFNKRALKIYIDDARVINIPNLEYNPTGFTLGFHSPSGTKIGYVKNVRIAKGAVPLYDKFLTDGKFVTTGIKFDVNKASIKTESMGTINYIVNMMKEHPELKFSVEGHTDADGDDAGNQKLSEARAKAVVDKLAELGIDQNRLKSKGWGESKPIADNSSTESKAQNRRVEFVKF